MTSFLKQKNKKKMLIGVLIIFLLIGGIITTAFMQAPEEKTTAETIVNNDNTDLGTPNADEIPDEKLEVKEDYDQMVDKDAKLSKKREDVFKQFNEIDQDKPSVSNNGTEEFQTSGNDNAKRSYDRAQAQLEQIEARKRQAYKKERERERKRQAEEDERKREREAEELRKWQEKQNESFFSSGNGNVSQSSNYNSSSQRGKNIMSAGPTDQMILATIKGDQKVKQGERVTLVLEEDYVINGVVYPRNTKIYGIVSLAKNRAKLQIAKINHDVVDMYVEDAQDGLEGIYVKGADVIGEIGQEATGEVIDEINVGSVPVGRAIKGIFKKKQKEIKVQLLNDYHVLLKPNL